jgi:hypothetical protein
MPKQEISPETQMAPRKDRNRDWGFRGIGSTLGFMALVSIPVAAPKGDINPKVDGYFIKPKRRFSRERRRELEASGERYAWVDTLRTALAKTSEWVDRF